MNIAYGIQLGMGILFVFLAVLLLFRFRKRNSSSLRNASLTVEELEVHAKRMAIDHTLVTKKRSLKSPIKRMEENYVHILERFKALDSDVSQKRAVPTSAEWLLDNFYIIENQVKAIKHDFDQKTYDRLPLLKQGGFKGMARVYAIAMEFVALVDGQVEENTLIRYLEAYQTHSILFDREIRVIPQMIQMALIDNIRVSSDKIKETQNHWNDAEDIFNKLMDEEEENGLENTYKILKDELSGLNQIPSSYIEHLFYKLRRSGKSYAHILKQMDTFLSKYDLTTEGVAQKEHNTQAVITVSMGNCVMSLKYSASLDWGHLFDVVSFVEHILQKDPEGVYGQMDVQTRNHYLTETEKLAKRYGVSELYVAREAVKLAESAYIKGQESNNSDKRLQHVGYYLIDDGVKDLALDQTGKASPFTRVLLGIKDNPFKVYLSTILFLMVLLLVGITAYVVTIGCQNPVLCAFLAILAAVIPTSELAISIVHWAVGQVKKPAVFSRLEFQNGIPDSCRTMVVIPVLLGNVERVETLLGRLESHYLANAERNLFFSLLGAYQDSEEPNTLKDEDIINYAIAGVERLNAKYGRDDQRIFYFYHRTSQYNEIDQHWGGWERKRGALMEFNELLLGSTDTTFNLLPENCIPEDVKYVITLDADTILPLGMAKKMIGTMAHPLNKPQICPEKGIVIAGHGLIQPRISFDIESSNRSIFSSVFTGQEGIDPYASSISDVYQDLFGEGIFTGKGIYDLKVFHRVLKDIVPENTVLSHDLLEGSYVRAALVSDLELVDAYPTRYNAYIARLYRWIRGDWQLIPWLKGTVTNRKGVKTTNPLSLVSKWKIIDNLRRSLVAPSLLLYAVVGVVVLPGSVAVWFGYGLVILGFPFGLHLAQTLFSGRDIDLVKRHISGFFGLKSSLFQLVLTFIFLPYQSMVILKAVIVTLIRVFITQKNMLEWVTSDDADRAQINTLGSYFRSMGPSSLVGIPLALVSYFNKPDQLLWTGVMAFLFLTGPAVAYLISIERKQGKVSLESVDLKVLRVTARKTWRYFEEFANSKNHFLAPDNYQEAPYRGIAHRTSPTNIGLGLLATLTARDMGYIGQLEMTSRITSTLSTIDQMEKWNGHLYNWYDTKTLKPLRPRYISTVDSGNYVGYLITLKQGLIAYRSKPLMDSHQLQGIVDTCLCGNDNLQALPIEITEISNWEASQKLSALKWLDLLDALTNEGYFSGIEEKPWLFKVQRMLTAYRGELLQFMPYLRAVVQCPNPVVLEALENILQDLPALNAIADLNHQMAFLIDGESQMMHPQISLHRSQYNEWKSEFKMLLEQSTQYTEGYLQGCHGLENRVENLYETCRFGFLYEPKRHLFSIGYNIEDNRLTNSYYDLLASEARQTSYIAIARGEVPAKHWFMLGRSLTVIDRYKGLISWSGTMFEYLMPLLIMKCYKNTLLDETYSFVIKSQMKYGKLRNMPWGASESGFFALDQHLDYQYKAIGVPWLGLKRGLVEDAVCAPYASFLALLVDPIEAYKNIQRLGQEGLEGSYGFYEAADYTPERLAVGQKRHVVKSYMAHHQGMTLLAINNVVNNGIMQKRFSSEPYDKAARLLLQERVPTQVIFTKENKEKIMPYKSVAVKDKGAYRRFTDTATPIPKTHVLSNGYYSVMVTDKGTGYSKNKAIAVTRWRSDAVMDHFGMFFYVKLKGKSTLWSTTQSPLNEKPDTYEVVFTPDKAVYKRTDGVFETTTEVMVSSSDAVEIRRIKLKNNGNEGQAMELTSYCEVVLADQNADLAHPVFSNLFIETHYRPEYDALVAYRRPRDTAEKGVWMAQMIVPEGHRVESVQYESDRALFLGRGRTAANPIVFDWDKPLSNTVGAVLDPILSLRVHVDLEAGEGKRFSFVTIVADTEALLDEMLEKYHAIETCDAAFWLAMSRSQVENRYLNIKAADMELYQNMMSHFIFLSPLRQAYSNAIRLNRKDQTALWPYGISGDRPILLLLLEDENHVEILYDVLKAHEYWRLKDLKIDLIILVKEENNYINPLQTMVNDILYSNRTVDGIVTQGDIFVLNANTLAHNDRYLLMAVSHLILSGDGSAMAEQVKDNYTELSMPNRTYTHSNGFQTVGLPEISTLYNNGYGGFTPAGDAYVIELFNGLNTPAPWSNVIANPQFGFLITELGGGYTWHVNSRENKLTPWSNDPISDGPSEVLYLSDEAGHLWTITPEPIREETPYRIHHGFGQTTFEHNAWGLRQKQTVFVPVEDAVKLILVELENMDDFERTITMTYYATPVLGVDRLETARHLYTHQNDDGLLMVDNYYHRELQNQVVFLEATITERSVTGDRSHFFGEGGFREPGALAKIHLDGRIGGALDPCLAMQVQIIIPPHGVVECGFVLGASEGAESATQLASKYSTVEAMRQALDAVKLNWQAMLQVIQVKTPDASVDLMLNGWLMYQVISCRLWGRSALYQSGGAYGFRDQLQDSLALFHNRPDLAKQQILKHAARQFKEGDVLHWWHEPLLRGTRTHISDDYLWLPYVVASYITATGDMDILKIQVPFLEADGLQPYEDERYLIPRISEGTHSLYEHCIRALNHCALSDRGLPLMGGGDWNDGMNKVGREGKGESVWLGWFYYATLQKFIPFCEKNGDTSYVETFGRRLNTLQEAIESHGWDGEWYRRAFFDDGTPLGSSKNSECRIDAIAQAWAVISGAGDPERSRLAMLSLENQLVFRDLGMIKLLTPPFNDGPLEPGYIKGYVPGIRENGGQYTHGVAWAIQAFGLLGEESKVHTYYSMLSPINHSRTRMEANIYKVEPYVMAADVYSESNHTGRGGWTWYTGSASWMYTVGIESLLGVSKMDDALFLNPCVPKEWTAFTMRYLFKSTVYTLSYLNPRKVLSSGFQLNIDGVDRGGSVIQLVDDGMNHEVLILVKDANGRLA